MAQEATNWHHEEPRNLDQRPVQEGRAERRWKIPQDVDRGSFGSRVRMRRMMVGMEPGEARGRQAASRPANSEVREGNKPDRRKPPTPRSLRILEVPGGFCLRGTALSQGSGEDPRGRWECTLDGPRSWPPPKDVELVKAFTAIKDQKVRRRIVDLAGAVAAGEE